MNARISSSFNLDNEQETNEDGDIINGVYFREYNWFYLSLFFHVHKS